MEGLFILLLYLTPICFILALLGYIADKIPNKAYRKIERKWTSNETGHKKSTYPLGKAR